MCFSILLHKIWQSPTLTSWGNAFTAISRLLILTPLILVNFNESEVAAWYLFASVNFMGALIAQRVTITFSRMIAYCLGGATDLSPESILHGNNQVTKKRPNWRLMKRVFGTICALNVFAALLNILLGILFGVPALENLIHRSERYEIYLAFSIFLVSNFIIYLFRGYMTALIGLSKVALLNRWQILIGMASVLSGVFSLLLGANILQLSLAVQVPLGFGIFIHYRALAAVRGGKMLLGAGYRIDRQVLAWAWPPAWKGLMSHVGLVGSCQLALVTFTHYGSKSDATSLLFSVRMLSSILQMALVPWNSASPQMAKLLASKKYIRFWREVQKRIILVTALGIMGIILSWIIFPLIIRYLEASVSLISPGLWLLCGSLMIVVQLQLMLCGVSALGNKVICYWQSLIAVTCVPILVFIFADSYGIIVPILSISLPILIFYGLTPLKSYMSLRYRSRHAIL